MPDEKPGGDKPSTPKESPKELPPKEAKELDPRDQTVFTKAHPPG